MREFAKVGSALWSSKKFKSLDPQSRLVYLYILTCRHATSVGCYSLPMGYAMHDLSMPEAEISAACGRLQSVGLIECDHDEDLVYVAGWVEFYRPTSPNHAKRMVYDVCNLPDGALKEKVAADVFTAMIEKGWQTEIELLKDCLSPSEALLKPLASAVATDLTSPDKTSPQQDHIIKKGFSGEEVNKVPRETCDRGPVATDGRRYLYEAFPQCSNSEDFANRLPDDWKAVYMDKFGHEDNAEPMAWACAVGFWDKFVGKYRGDQVADGYPAKKDWFRAWDHYVDGIWRKQNNLPEKKVLGSGAKAKFQKLIGVGGGK